MPLLGQAAMLLSFDVAPDAIADHDDWHTHEHLPERLAIPGFKRGTRWVARTALTDGHEGLRYVVLYEVAELAILTSAAYLERLDNPSPWTSKVMPHYRGMVRGLCTVSGSFGLGVGHVCMLIRFKPVAEMESSLRGWLLEDVLAQLPSRAGLGSAHLLEGAATPAMTNEQRIRGADAGVDWAILVTGYDETAISALMRGDLGKANLEQRGATGVVAGLYGMHYSLTNREACAR